MVDTASMPGLKSACMSWKASTGNVMVSLLTRKIEIGTSPNDMMKA